MNETELRDHLRKGVDPQAFGQRGWHCVECQITLFHLAVMLEVWMRSPTKDEPTRRAGGL